MTKKKIIKFHKSALAKDKWCEAGEPVEFNAWDADYFIDTGRAEEVKENKKAASRTTKEEKSAKRTK